ncbi:unnamed protein product [Oikopleura dioica]|uniref:Uncharacterized protein n=1 Tax=Oikopleura dioica TaxID=34765 RepID=E4XZV8_OIKDI|nr:unnamed protein product [Oikopleura dioica]
MSIPDRQAFRIGSPMRSPSPIRQTNRSPAPFSGNKITSIIVNSISRPGTPSERADSRIEVITPDVHYYEPSSRYTPDLPNRTLVQAPTNYRDFLQTTPPAGRRAESNPADGDVKVTKIIRKVPPSPGSHRKISTGSQSGRVRRVPPKEKQPVLIASIANFDGQEQRKHSSVKPPRISSGAQTDFSDTGSDVVQPGAEISISIQAGLDFAGSQISRRKDSRGKCQVELVNSPSHSRASSNVCTRELVLSPPPTPPPPRKTSLADEIISKNEDMLSSFPPPPARNLHEFQIGNELEGLPPQEPASGSPKVPPKPRLDRKTSLKLKQRAHVNSQEVHRSKAGVFDLENKPDTPIFSDAENSHFSAAILSDGKTTAAEDTEIESVRKGWNKDPYLLKMIQKLETWKSLYISPLVEFLTMIWTVLPLYLCTRSLIRRTRQGF